MFIPTLPLFGVNSLLDWDFNQDVDILEPKQFRALQGNKATRFEGTPGFPVSSAAGEGAFLLSDELTAALLKCTSPRAQQKSFLHIPFQEQKGLQGCLLNLLLESREGGETHRSRSSSVPVKPGESQLPLSWWIFLILPPALCRQGAEPSHILGSPNPRNNN